MPTTTYQTVSQLKEASDIEDAADDGQLLVAITAASRLFDEYCGRRFYVDDDANQVRYYTADDHGLLFVDDVVTLTTLKTNTASNDDVFETTWTSVTDFRLEPLNAAQNSADVRPYTRIRAVGTRSFPMSVRGVEVTGKFGWPAVPENVKLACLIQAGLFFKRMDGAMLGQLQSVAFDSPGPRVASRYLDGHVQLLLFPYIRYDLAAV